MRLFPLLAAAAACVLLTAAAREPSVDYVVRPLMDRGELRAVMIEMRFTGEADGTTRFQLPDRWAGERALYRNLSGLTVEGGADKEDVPGLHTVTHRPGARITVRYRVRAGYPGDPLMGDSYKPVIQPGWFHLLGETVFAEPEDQDQRPATVAWKGWPKDWTIASDLQHGAGPMRLGAVRESVSLGGKDVTGVERPIHGGVARIALRGTWAFKTDDLGETLAGILDAQRRFWGDLEGPYLVTLIPTPGPPGAISLGGTGRGDAFAMFATTNADVASLRYLIAHEHMHSWLPRRVGRMPPRKEAEDYWFSEGFTDFYTYRTLMASDLWSLEDFAEYANQTLGMYDVSSVRAAPNGRIAADFWKDAEVEKLPYQRGMLLAFVWDRKIREATGGRKDLDDVLFLMRDRMAAAETRDEAALVRDGLARAMKDVAGLDIAGDLASHVDAGEPVVLTPQMFGGCFDLRLEQRPVFERGWDPEATERAGNVVTGLKTDSPAYAAGLRDGMKLLAREGGKPGDSRVEYVVRVQDGAAERVIRFFPKGAAAYPARELVLKPGLDDAARKACAARLGGA